MTPRYHALARPIVALLVLHALLLPTAAAADCPQPVQSATAAQAGAMAFDPDAVIDVESDGFDALRDGEWKLNGEVTLTQSNRTLRTRDATYAAQTGSFQTANEVEYTDPNLKVHGSSAQFDPAGGVQFEGAQFELPVQNGRGSAQQISASPEGELALDDVRYTTCPLGNEDWLIRAADIDISQRRGVGSGRGVRLDFKGVPILYTPFISFPVGNERKSGFLFPVFGNSERSGYMLSVPWYWNIAPTYDATFIPTGYSKRGVKLDTEFRYLSAFGHGAFNGEYLPHDQRTGESRSLLRFTDQSDLTQQLRLNIDATNASDSQWFEDFGLGPEGTSASYLNRSAGLTYLTDHWLITGQAQNFQTIDDQRIAAQDRPFTLLPQLGVHAALPDFAYGLTFGFDAELANFERNFSESLPTNETGWRVDVAPQIRLPLRGAGLYLEPSLEWRYTAYRIDDRRPGSDDAPARAAPILSVNGGMTFERPAGSHHQRLQTLEPRFMYLYVPYRNQDALPVFDTAAADLNLVQLFSNNRYVGADRLSNANQVSMGFTSRLLDAATGQQYLEATIGQAYYIEAPRVALPNEVLDDPETSDVVAELALTAYRNWTVRMGMQFDPSESRAEKGDVHFQYQPRYDRVMNLGYRFRRDNIEQVDASVAWPIGKQWGAYGRLVYSLQDRSALDQFVGIEYRACCWKLRLVSHHYVNDRAGGMDTSLLLQLELNGLSSVGVGADAFLERSIRGYSPRAPQAPGRAD